jgi:acetyl esterase/lipase
MSTSSSTASSTLHLVDPELVAPLETFPAFVLTKELLPMLREGQKQMMAAMPKPENPGVKIEAKKIPGLEGPEVGVMIYTPLNATGPLPAVLHMHGGGYLFGNAEMMDIPNTMLAAQLQCVVVSVDYRLAPETHFPGPLNDCYAALKWLHDHAAELSVDPKRIATKGESAGGGLAAALALMARDKGEVPIIFQQLDAPMLDDRTCTTQTPNAFTGEFVWNRDANHFAWSSMLGQEPGSAGISQYAAAARAESLAGLPATYILVGALDLFLEEDIDYAKGLLAAGVPTELHVYPGVYHGFQIAQTSRVVQESYRESLAALGRALAAK